MPFIPGISEGPTQTSRDTWDIYKEHKIYGPLDLLQMAHNPLTSTSDYTQDTQIMESHYISHEPTVLFGRIRRLVPPLLEKFHKGQHGRVAVIGGSTDYTGAPTFSAMASGALGCDMNHVLCEKSAAPAIKSYSPDLMVHPLLPSSNTTEDAGSINAKDLAGPIINMLARLHCLVIGPGLGTDPVTSEVVSEVMQEARGRSIPFVLDADGLKLVNKRPGLVKGYRECILTPNVVELARLAESVGVDMQKIKRECSDSMDSRAKDAEVCRRLSEALGGVTIVRKGPYDVISNGIASLIQENEGGLKRSGGQGDTLTGSLGTLMGWRAAYHDKLWDSGEKDERQETSRKEGIEREIQSEVSLSPATSRLLVAWAGSGITRECSRRAYEAKGRSMQASDLTAQVHDSFLALVGEPEASKL
ncbi:Ribokinase-like protein [Aspergillus crustosus]